MLSVDEAIANEREVAKEIYIEAMLCHANPNDEKLDDCIERGKYHEQLVELLEELKKRRSEDYGYMADIHQSIGYRQALDDIKEELMKNGFIYTQHALDVFDGIAKQLKEGN